MADKLSNTLSDHMATLPNGTVTFWTTVSSYTYQGTYFAQIYGNFKGKTLTLTNMTIYNGSSSYNVTSTASFSVANDFCVNITNTAASIGGTPCSVVFTVS